LCWGAGLADKVKGHCVSSALFFLMRIDLNADVGESTAGDESALLCCVTSVNIACGFHAGDPALIRKTVRLAHAHGLNVGAHPSLADREGFGRRSVSVEPARVEDEVLYQLSALMGIAAAESVSLSHVKPHGALYHMTALDESTAAAVARAARLVSPALRVVGLAGSKLISVARNAGLSTLSEAFVDRAYEPDGQLVPRERPGAVIHDLHRVVEQALRLVLHHRVLSMDGSTEVTIAAETLCIHGDTPDAPRLAEAVRRSLEREGVVVAAPGR
jgi:UPF0271 protein